MREGGCAVLAVSPSSGQCAHWPSNSPPDCSTPAGGRNRRAPSSGQCAHWPSNSPPDCSTPQALRASFAHCAPSTGRRAPFRGAIGPCEGRKCRLRAFVHMCCSSCRLILSLLYYNPHFMIHPLFRVSRCCNALCDF